jgi:cyanophycinase-like exopeptidase
MSNNDPITPEILDLFEKRNSLRKEKKYAESDEVRKELESRGYSITDSPTESTIVKIQEDEPVVRTKPEGLGKIALFGSGELSPTGRRIHELLIQHIQPPVGIALVETAAGFEDNPHKWYEKLFDMMSVGLQSAKPHIHIISALRCDGQHSTNNENILADIGSCQYIHLGAGSPTYAAKHIKNSLLLELIEYHVKNGYPISLASASSTAFGKYVLPVYEIYKAGFDPYWEEGINLFGDFGLDLTIVPHFNNEEGGESIDTRFCYMGERRFKKLVKMLPEESTILGIDEQTAGIIDLEARTVEVLGAGTATIIRNSTETVVKTGETVTLF